MKAKERLEYIRNQIERNGRAQVTELRQACGVTETTIRRDLEKLEETGAITRIHGGAMRNSEQNPEGVRFYQRRTANLPAKKKIAKLLLTVLEGKRTIIADSSTTVAEALKEICMDASLSIVTNSAEIFHLIPSAASTMISTGGNFNPLTLSLQGEQAVDSIDKFYVDLALISCKSVHREMGVLDSNETEVYVKRRMIDRAEKVALLVDHTKFDGVAFLKLMDFDRVNYLITDRTPPREWIRFCEDRHIKLVWE